MASPAYGRHCRSYRAASREAADAPSCLPAKNWRKNFRAAKNGLDIRLGQPRKSHKPWGASRHVKQSSPSCGTKFPPWEHIATRHGENLVTRHGKALSPALGKPCPFFSHQRSFFVPLPRGRLAFSHFQASQRISVIICAAQLQGWRFAFLPLFGPYFYRGLPYSFLGC